jgi:hypothetical protein
MASPRAARPNGTNVIHHQMTTEHVDTATLIALAGGMAGAGATLHRPQGSEGQADEEKYRRLFESELQEVNRVKKRVSKMLKKKAKEDKRRREAERVYSDLNKDQSVRKLAKVFGESSDRLPTAYRFEGDLGSLSGSKNVTTTAKRDKGKGKEEKREREKEKARKRKKRRGEKSEAKRSWRGAATTNNAAGVTASSSGGALILSTSSGDDGGSGSDGPRGVLIGRRGWDMLAARDEQDKAWLREVMDERKKLAADKRMSQEASFTPRSPRLVNLAVSVRLSFLVSCA